MLHTMALHDPFQGIYHSIENLHCRSQAEWLRLSKLPHHLCLLNYNYNVGSSLHKVTKLQYVCGMPAMTWQLLFQYKYVHLTED